MVNDPQLYEFLMQEIARAAAAGYPRCIGCGSQLGPQWHELPTQDGCPICGSCVASARPSLCQCCLSAVGRPPIPAVHRWTGPHGNVTPLCSSCCAHWQANARDDPSLAPRSIDSIER